MEKSGGREGGKYVFVCVHKRVRERYKYREIEPEWGKQSEIKILPGGGGGGGGGKLPVYI